MQPLIVLLSDFGHQDAYVGILKGVILSLCPQTQLIDLCHEIPAGDLTTAAWQLMSAVDYFPAGTIFVSIVDPGVGSARKAIALEVAGKYFVCPDNGILSWLLKQSGSAWQGVSLDKACWHLPNPSQTFHGRDIFAPVAAHLARGLGLSELGSPLENLVELKWPQFRSEAHTLQGEILLWDHFGNLISNLPASALAAYAPDKLQIQIASRQLQGLKQAYAESPKGELLGIIGSSGYLEICLNQGSAQQELQAYRGMPCEIFIKAP